MSVASPNPGEPEALRYEIRAGCRSDRDALLDLARYLNSVNLPHDADAIDEVVGLSEDSFSGKIKDPRFCRWVFVLWDREENRAVGTSMVIGQLGRKDAAYVYFDVIPEEKYSPTLDRHFQHRVLRIGYSYNGPTEIGGLVVHPAHRRRPAKLGRLISYVRFLFIAMHRRRMQDQVLAELMPPLEPDGTSHLWEAVGRRFTGLGYRQADHLSKTNKAFIRSLFPDGDIYASLLSEPAQRVIGEVGDHARGVEKMLRRIGFRYVDRVDPFDGGPHFAAATDEIAPVQRSRCLRAERGEGRVPVPALVARGFEDEPWFTAAPARVAVHEMRARLSPQVADRLEIRPEDSVWVLPLEEAR